VDKIGTMSKNKFKFYNKAMTAQIKETMNLISICWTWKIKYNKIKSGLEMNCNKYNKYKILKQMVSLFSPMSK
jgi:hypothetical protein